MIEMLKKRRGDNEEGFTLIELMVVVLIIGILLAIAVPTFLSAQKNAKKKAATANLRTALSAVKTVYADKQEYTAASMSTTNLEEAENSLVWKVGTTSALPNEISVTVGTNVVGLANKSKLNDCYYIIDNVSTTGGGTFFGKSTPANAGDPCTAVTTGYTATTPDAAGW